MKLAFTYRGLACRIGLGLVLLSGCSTAPDIHREITEEVHQTAQSSVRGGTRKPLGSVKLRSAGLDQVLAEVVARDSDFQIARADVRLAGVELAQARCDVLPRLVTRGVVQIPINNSQTEVVCSGGAYLQFDVMRALLYRNHVTVAQVTSQAKVEDCQSAVARGCFLLFSRLIRMGGVQQVIHEKEAAGRIAQQASMEADALFRSGEVSSEICYGWKRRAGEAVQELHRLTVSMEKARAELNECFDSPVDPEELKPVKDAFFKRIAADPKVSADQTADMLEQSPAVNKARLGLFLAEMEVIEARLKRLPKVSLDLAGGKIPLYNSDSTTATGFVPMIEASMPIFDMGDISREIERARIRAGQARERAKHAVQTSYQEMQSTARDLALARTSAEMAHRAVEGATARVSETRALNQSGQASAIEVHEATWALAEAGAIEAQANADCQLAMLSHRAAWGLLVDPALKKEIFARLDMKKR